MKPSLQSEKVKEESKTPFVTSLSEEPLGQLPLKSQAHDPETSKHNSIASGLVTAPVPETRGHKGCLAKYGTEIKGISGDDIMGFSSGLTSVSSPPVLTADTEPICRLLSISKCEPWSQWAAFTTQTHRGNDCNIYTRSS